MPGFRASQTLANRPASNSVLFSGMICDPLRIMIRFSLYKYTQCLNEEHLGKIIRLL